MKNPDPKEIARMLRKPEGEFGMKVAEKMNESNARIIQWAVEKLDLQDHEKVLEIGFGNGFHIRNLLETTNGLQYTGIDFSETMVEIAAKKYGEAIKQGRVAFFLGSSASMPFSSETFDKIFSVNTLYFWDDPNLHLQQIYNVLKPGGIFCLGFKSRTFMRHLPFTPHGFTLYEQEEVVALLEKNRFTIKDVSYNQENEQEIGGVLLTPDAILVAATKK